MSDIDKTKETIRRLPNDLTFCRITPKQFNALCDSHDEQAAEIERLTVFSEVVNEVNRATHKFPTWPTDPLHALAVLGEEFGELTKAVLQHTYEPEKSSLSDVKEEAIQTAAMALRFVLSLSQYEYSRCEQHQQAALGGSDDKR